MNFKWYCFPGLFHRAIAMSASPFSQVVIGTEQKYLAERQAKLFNCPTDTSKEIIDCLKTKTWREIGDSLDNMFVSSRSVVNLVLRHYCIFIVFNNTCAYCSHCWAKISLFLFYRSWYAYLIRLTNRRKLRRYTLWSL